MSARKEQQNDNENDRAVCPESTLESANARNKVPVKASNRSNSACESTIESSLRRDFIKRAALVTAAGAAGVLVAQPLKSKLIPTSEAACGGPLILGQSNIACRSTQLFGGHPDVSVCQAFVVQNCFAGGTAIAAFAFGQGVAFCGTTECGPAIIASSNSPFTGKFKNRGNFGPDKTALIQYETGDSSPINWYSGVAGSGNGLGLADGTFFIENFGGSELVIGANNNVGIGTNTPNAKLSFGTFEGDSIFLYDGTNTKYGFGIRASELRVFHGTDTSSNHTSFGKYDGSTFTEFMRLNNQGQLGIGTTTPQTTLQVNGTVEATKLGIGTASPKTPLQVVGTMSGSALGLGTTTPKTTLQVNGSVSAKVAIKTTSYSMADSDFAILASGAIKITLPAASNTGMVAFIKNISTSTVTVAPIGTDKIEGSTAARTLTKQFASLTLMAGGNGVWYVLANAT
jgi:hypothetical protein